MSNKLGDTAVRQIQKTIDKVWGKTVNERTRRPVHGAGTNQIHLCRASGNISQGESSDMEVYTGATKGEETANGTILRDVYSRIGDYTADKDAYVGWVLGGWEIINTECAE